jgi:hypothetical protein
MSRDRYSVSDVEEMLLAGTFHPGEDLQIRVRAALRKPAPSFPVPRFAWMVGLTVLLAVLVLAGIAIALSPKEKAAGIVGGIRSVYEAGLVHPTHETQQVGDISLTVDWVYADWNQVLVGYTAQGRAGDDARVGARILSARLADGTALGGDAIAGYGEMGADSSVAAFDMPKSMRDRQSIDLQLVLWAGYEQYQTPTGMEQTEDAHNPSQAGVPFVQIEPVEVITTGRGEASFEFSIPITPGRVIEVDQTVESSGYAVALEEVVLAPSMTTARLCFEVPDPVNFRQWFSFVTVKTGFQSYRGAGDEYQVSMPFSCQRVEIRESVPLDRERYIFYVDELVGFEFGAGEVVTTDMLPEEQRRIKGPWVFRLNVQP